MNTFKELCDKQFRLRLHCTTKRLFIIILRTTYSENVIKIGPVPHMFPHPLLNRLKLEVTSTILENVQLRFNGYDDFVLKTNGSVNFT